MSRKIAVFLVVFLLLPLVALAFTFFLTAKAYDSGGPYTYS